MSASWECSEKSGVCFFEQKKHEILVVIYREPGVKYSFKWLRLYNSDTALGPNEYLFWAEIFESEFILMSAYNYNMGQIRTYFHKDTVAAEHLRLFDATRRDKTEGFGLQIKRLKKIMNRSD